MSSLLLESPLAAQLEVVYSRLILMMRAQGVDRCEQLVASSAFRSSVCAAGES